MHLAEEEPLEGHGSLSPARAGGELQSTSAVPVLSRDPRGPRVPVAEVWAPGRRRRPLTPPVVCAEENEFILFATRKSIHRYDLASGATEQLPLAGLRAAVALDFDYARNCLYWSDLALDLIQVSGPGRLGAVLAPARQIHFFPSGRRRGGQRVQSAHLGADGRTQR